MIALVAKLKIKPGMEKEAAALCLEMTAAVRREEKGCLYYEPYMPADGKPEIYFLEKYVNHEALDLHRQTEHFKNFRKEIASTLQEPTEGTLLESIENRQP